MKTYFGFLGAMLCACGPADRSGTVNAWVYTQEQGNYRLQASPLTNLESLNGLTGNQLKFRRGAELRDVLNSTTINPGHPFDFEYSLDKDGIVVPGDLHSFYAASAYHGFSRAIEILESRGYEPEPLNVFYFPYIDGLISGDLRSNFIDNAAFFPEASAFLILPGMMLGNMPLMLNEGVAAHEYGHAVVQKELGDKTTLTTTTLEFASMNEGVADLIGFAVTGDANYIQMEGTDRDMSKPRSFTEEDSRALYKLTENEKQDSKAKTDPHYYGSTMARSVFEAWPGTLEEKLTESSRMALLDSILTALRRTREEQWMWGVSREIAATLPSAQRDQACKVLRQRFDALLVLGLIKPC